jgi:leucyl aminopeptidase
MLKVSFSTTVNASKTLIITVANTKELSKFVRSQFNIDELELLKEAIYNSNFTGALNQTLTVPMCQRSVMLIGIGEANKLTSLEAENVGGTVVTTVTGKYSDATLLVSENTDLIVAHIAYGATLRSYQFNKYKTKTTDVNSKSLKNLSIACHGSTGAAILYKPLEKIAESIFIARDLITEPGNVVTPVVLTEAALTLKKLGVKVTVIDAKKAKKLGMGALLFVGQASKIPPRLVVLEYRGNKKNKDAPVCLVGKGITFDTGGLSLKSGNGMMNMKHDMSGAAAVLGTIRSLAANKSSVNVTGIMAIAENAIDNSAGRPDDVIKTMSGQTVEVLNTDAEGRLVLADAVWYAQEKLNAKCVVDIATLTGAISVCLGKEYAGLFSNDDKLTEQLINAGKEVGEELWRLPVSSAYDKLLDSNIADMQNIGVTGGPGSSIGAQFVKRFIKDETTWAHLDIAAVAWSDKDMPTCPKGAVAYGVKLLTKFVEEYKS